MKRKATYDTACYDLADSFLGDEPTLHTAEHIDELATLIQRTIEDYIAHERKPDERS